MEKIQPEKVVATLREDGIIVTGEEAKKILGFLRMMVGIAVEQYLGKEENKFEKTEKEMFFKKNG